MKFEKKFEISKEELEEYIKNLPMTKIGEIYGVSSGAIKKRAIKLNIDYKKISKYVHKNKSNTPPYNKKEWGNCKQCGKQLTFYKKIYCSVKCQFDYKHEQKIKKWKEDKEGKIEGCRGDYQISGYLKTYLFNKYNNKCSICSWDKENPYTKKIPLEVEHIDGNSSNNKEENLLLLCPNCHSLTSTYKGANKGNGRYKRRERYKLGQSS